MKNSIAVVIYTHNEEKNILECINSAKLLTESVYVIDMKSSDQTVSIAEKHGANIHTFPYSQYVEPAREFGIRKAKSDWVFILDADERITKELAQEIQEKIMNKVSFFKVSRKNMFAGTTWLKHGGWWPDYQMRLINLKSFLSWPKQIHSTPQITGNCEYLTNSLLHLFHGKIDEMVKKTISFENIESDLLFQAKKPVTIITFFRKFLGELVRRLIIKKGFLDGSIGIIESIYQAYSKTITYLFLYEKKISSI